MNKVLKDLVVKFNRMSGKHSPFVPGWDCHGLPIELKVTKLHEDKPPMDRKQLRQACGEYAREWMTKQMNEFKRLGVLADWDHPYLTMTPQYEVLRALLSLPIP